MHVLAKIIRDRVGRPSQNRTPEPASSWINCVKSNIYAAILYASILPSLDLEDRRALTKARTHPSHRGRMQNDGHL
jgi:hypothetical protein